MILTAIESPDFRSDDPRPRRERFYRRNVLSPNRWLRVVVDFTEEPGWVVTAGADPRSKVSAAMSVNIVGIEFEHHHYDPRGDVLYLNAAGYDGESARAYETEEGHNVEYDASGQIVSIVLVNVKWLLDRDGELTITWPAGHLTVDELAPAMVSAA